MEKQLNEKEKTAEDTAKKRTEIEQVSYKDQFFSRDCGENGSLGAIDEDNEENNKP